MKYVIDYKTYMILLTNRIYYEKLENALGLSGITYCALPIYDFTDKQPALVASVSFKL